MKNLGQLDKSNFLLTLSTLGILRLSAQYTMLMKLLVNIHVVELELHILVGMNIMDIFNCYLQTFLWDNSCEFTFENFQGAIDTTLHRLPSPMFSEFLFEHLVP
jgi:hypothetical protein